MFPFGTRRAPATDKHGAQLVRAALQPGAFRDRLTRDIFISDDPNDRLGLLDYTLAKAVASEAADKKLERAIRKGEVRRFHDRDWIADAEAKGVLDAAEARSLAELRDLVARVIAVDDFSAAELARDQAAARASGGSQSVTQARTYCRRVEQPMAMTLPDLQDWRFTVDFEGIAWAIIDRQGESMNSLGRGPTEELGEIVKAVEDMATRGEVKGLVLMSGKESSFIAGADIREFEGFDTEGKIAEVVKQTLELLNRIDRLSVPVVAAIHGYCLGGGLELALACDWRIADREEGTRLGFPEVKLGIFPGLNGTVRAIQAAGPTDAMTAMLTGRMLRPTAAKAIGLVDQLGTDPPHAALGRAQSRAAEAPLQGRAVVEAADAEAAGALHARQADARQDGREGARGALSRAVPADRSVREVRRRSRAHEDRRDRDVHAADGERGLAQFAPRVQAVGDAEG